MNGTTATDAASALLFGEGTMLRSDPHGAIAADAAAPAVAGLFVGDTRILSELDVGIDGRELAIASVRSGNGTRRTVFVPKTARNEPGDVLLAMTQTVSAAGLDEEMVVHNSTGHNLSVALTVRFATDFADQFALRSDGRAFDRTGASVTTTRLPSGVTFTYTRARAGLRFSAGLAVATSVAPAISIADAGAAGTFTWHLDVPAHGSVSVPVTFHAAGDAPTIGTLERREPGAWSPLRERSLDDIESLRMPCPGAPDLTILAAGIPWFLTLFGRDSLIASLLSNGSLPGILDDVLRALAATQATETNPRRVEQPGKIVHELRVSELAALDQIPYGRYYGSVDSTPLFLIGLAASNDADLVASLQGAARAAVGWMLGPGGIDEHGFLRYVPDPDGLIHQGWKDSHDAIAHADGTIATGAIALCEVQGYAWRALTDTARLAREVWRDDAWAVELEGAAARLRARFRDEFWIPEANFPALAIDGSGKRVEVIASNAGHLLWSGILGDEDARRVTDRLLQDDMFTGWGIRTLSKYMTRYHPLSYHNGSVWPHDTMLAAVGMEAHGFTAQARLLAQGMTDAAAHFDWRLPELFGGFDRRLSAEPVGYSQAARPQAWAAAAGVTAARILGQ